MGKLTPVKVDVVRLSDLSGSNIYVLYTDQTASEKTESSCFFRVSG